MQLPLIFSIGPAYCDNPFWDKVIFTYSCHYVRNDGIYIVSEHVLLWAYVSIGRVINYDWWHIRVKSNFFWGFHSWIEYMAYPILWKISEKRVYFGVDFGRLIYYLISEITWICILPPGSAFCLDKSVVGTLIQLSLNSSSLESIWENKTPNIRMIAKAKKRWVQNTYRGFFTFCKINIWFKMFRCVRHDLLVRTSVTFLPYGLYITGIRIVVHHTCTW